VAPNGRVVDPLLESSLEMRYTLRATPKLHLLAEVITPLPADATLAAWNAYFERNAVANGKSIDVRADGHDFTGRFMTKGQWRTSTEVAVGKLLIIAYIRSADSSRLDFYLKLANRRFFDCSCFLNRWSG